MHLWTDLNKYCIFGHYSQDGSLLYSNDFGCFRKIAIGLVFVVGALMH